jgi:hypothetical protein
MAVVTTKSPSIINYDASPIIIPTIGEGADGMLRCANDAITSVVGDTNGSIYRICRLPTNAKIKKVLLNIFTASTAGAGDIDVFFSDSLTDGTQYAFSQLANPAVLIAAGADNKLFGAAQSLTATANQKDITFGNASSPFTAQFQNLPLWQVLVALGATQFVADPGGFFDIGFKLTTSITVTAGIISMEVDYVE